MIFFKFGTDGLYCVTKDKMFFRTFCFSWSADFLSVNLTSESIFSTRSLGQPRSRRHDLKLLIFSSKSGFEELVLRSLRASPLIKPFATPGA